jgi:hypothetical protein
MHRVPRWWDEEERRAPARGERRQRGRLHGGHVEQQRHMALAAEARWRGRNSAGSARCRMTRGRKTPGLSETNWVGTVALGRAQFGAQCCFAIIQTLLRFQNIK